MVAESIAPGKLSDCRAGLVSASSRPGKLVVRTWGIADVTHPDVVEKILEHAARQQAPPEFSAISRVATVH